MTENLPPLDLEDAMIIVRGVKAHRREERAEEKLKIDKIKLWVFIISSIIVALIIGLLPYFLKTKN